MTVFGRRVAIVALAVVPLGCGVEVKKPEVPRLRLAYDLLAEGCTSTSRGGLQGDDVLLKTWLGVHGRYPYETNMIRAAAEARPDASGKVYGELTVAEVATIEECRVRADKIAGIGR